MPTLWATPPPVPPSNNKPASAALLPRKRKEKANNDEDEDSLFIVRNGYVSHYMLGMAGEKFLSILGDFFSRRGDKTRWMPATEDEFLAYDVDEVHIESPEAEEFEEFLSKHGLEDDDKRLEMLLPIMYDHQYGVSTQRSLSNLMAHLTFKTQKDTIEQVKRLRQIFQKVKSVATILARVALARSIKSVAAVINRHRKKKEGEPKVCALGTGQVWPSTEEAIDTRMAHSNEKPAAKVPRVAFLFCAPSVSLGL